MKWNLLRNTQPHFDKLYMMEFEFVQVRDYWVNMLLFPRQNCEYKMTWNSEEYLLRHRAVFTWLSKGIGFGFGFGFTTPFGCLVYVLWFWFYDSQVKTALNPFWWSCVTRKNQCMRKFTNSKVVAIILFSYSWTSLQQLPRRQKKVAVVERF